MENILEGETTNGTKQLLNVNKISYLIKKSNDVRVSFDNDNEDDDEITNINFDKFKEYLHQFIEIVPYNNENILINPNNICHFGKYKYGGIYITQAFRNPIYVYFTDKSDNQYKEFKKHFDQNTFIKVKYYHYHYHNYDKDNDNISYVKKSNIKKIYINDDNVVTISFFDNSILNIYNSYDEIKEELMNQKEVKAAKHK
jgi:hypothetical protein